MSAPKEEQEATESRYRLEGNLKTLMASNPALADRLTHAVGSDHVRESEAGTTEYRYRRAWFRLSMERKEIESPLARIDPHREIFIFGLGFGEHVLTLLGRYPKCRITVWDRDPWLFRLLLTRHDLTGPIGEGRLKPALCGDLLDCLERGGKGQWVVHPFMKNVYRYEHRLLKEGPGKQRAVICEGELFVDDLAEALQREGYSVFPMDPVLLSREEMGHLVDRVQPDFVAVIDYRNGMTEFCHERGVRLLCWEINPSADRIQRPATTASNVHLFTYRPGQVAEFREAGYRNVEYLPLATNPKRRRKVTLSFKERERYGSEFSFVGSSMVEQAARHREAFLDLFRKARPNDPGFPGEVSGALDAVLAAQRADFSVYRIPELFERHFGGLMDTVRLDREAMDPLKLVAEISASEKRIAYVGGLGFLGIRVWGDPGWKGIEARGGRYMGPAAHLVELNKIYSGTRINIDVGRIYQSDMVPMRVFDILACGGFLLAEYSPALAELFQVGREVECYRNLQELCEKAAFFRERPREAQKVAGKGLERICSDHTFAHRVRRMLEVLGR